MGNQLEVPAADEKKTEKSKEKVYDDFLCFMNSIPVEILCMILKCVLLLFFLLDLSYFNMNEIE